MRTTEPWKGDAGLRHSPKSGQRPSGSGRKQVQASEHGWMIRIGSGGAGGSAAFMAVFSQFKGTLLAVDEPPEVIAGEWTATRPVMMSFPDAAAFHEWFDSPAYQAIAEHRHAGSTGVVLLAKGLGG